jgi:hypothetical protein
LENSLGEANNRNIRLEKALREIVNQVDEKLKPYHTFTDRELDMQEIAKQALAEKGEKNDKKTGRETL